MMQSSLHSRNPGGTVEETPGAVLGCRACLASCHSGGGEPYHRERGEVQRMDEAGLLILFSVHPNARHTRGLSKWGGKPRVE